MKLPVLRLKKGFTLVELMVVVAIVAVISTIGANSYITYLKRGRDVKRKADIEQIRTALEMYRADNGYYPSQASWGNVSALPLTSYLSGTPSDPQQAANSSWQYRYISTDGAGLPIRYYGYCLASGFEVATGSDSCGNPPTTETLSGRVFNYRVAQP